MQGTRRQEIPQLLPGPGVKLGGGVQEQLSHHSWCEKGRILTPAPLSTECNVLVFLFLGNKMKFLH